MTSVTFHLSYHHLTHHQQSDLTHINHRRGVGQIPHRTSQSSPLSLAASQNGGEKTLHRNRRSRNTHDYVEHANDAVTVPTPEEEWLSLGL